MEHYQLLAQYNQKINERLYRACFALEDSQLKKNQGAFFESIFGTLNHILLGDIFWYNRCSPNKYTYDKKDQAGNNITITSLRQILYDNMPELYAQRQKLDQLILNFVDQLSPTDVAAEMQYKNSMGHERKHSLGLALTHWFNHQTHHRGQITVMLSQQGIDYGVTDLVLMQ